MKYMTFNSSCSYAGLANLLSWYGIDTEDREIALRIGLPYFFACEDGNYLSGPMLQGAKWFDLYLNPLGFAFSERKLNREPVCADLQAKFPVMLGLRVTPQSKHAVIYTGRRDGAYQFLNNKREASPEPETLCLSETDLFARLDEQVTIGCLERIAPAAAEIRPILEDSVQVLKSLRREIHAFCVQEKSVDLIREAMNTLFRPVLLDGVTMLELLEEAETAASLKSVQAQLLYAVRAGRPAVLERELDMQRMDAAMSQYEKLIIKHMETT